MGAWSPEGDGGEADRRQQRKDRPGQPPDRAPAARPSGRRTRWSPARREHGGLRPGEVCTAGSSVTGSPAIRPSVACSGISHRVRSNIRPGDEAGGPAPAAVRRKAGRTAGSPAPAAGPAAAPARATPCDAAAARSPPARAPPRHGSAAKRAGRKGAPDGAAVQSRAASSAATSSMYGLATTAAVHQADAPRGGAASSSRSTSSGPVASTPATSHGSRRDHSTSSAATAATQPSCDSRRRGATGCPASPAQRQNSGSRHGRNTAACRATGSIMRWTGTSARAAPSALPGPSPPQGISDRASSPSAAGRRALAPGPADGRYGEDGADAEPGDRLGERAEQEAGGEHLLAGFARDGAGRALHGGMEQQPARHDRRRGAASQRPAQGFAQQEAGRRRRARPADRRQRADQGRQAGRNGTTRPEASSATIISQRQSWNDKFINVATSCTYALPSSPSSPLFHEPAREGRAALACPGRAAANNAASATLGGSGRRAGWGEPSDGESGWACLRIASGCDQPWPGACAASQGAGRGLPALRAHRLRRPDHDLALTRRPRPKRRLRAGSPPG